MNDLLELGNFQFENLIRNRIPFVLLNLGADLQNLFPSFIQEQLDRQSIPTTAAQALAVVKEKNLTKDQALIVVCQNGLESPQVADDLYKQGFHNVYFLRDGARNLRPGPN